MECSIKSAFGALLFMLFVSSVISTDQQYIFKPSHYKLEIITKKDHYEAQNNLKRFDGKVTIDFNSEKKINGSFTIVLDADSQTELKKGSDNKQYIKLQGALTGPPLKPVTVIKGEIKNGKLVIEAKTTEEMNEFQLTVEFSNPFRDDMTGFYRSSYKDTDGKESVLLTTHFEPIFARRAFPCFDKPDLKATFEIIVTAPKDIKTVLSNTEKLNSTSLEDGQLVTYNFKKTDIPMSTYLVAFTASNLIGTESVEFISEYEKVKGTFESQNKKTLTTYGRKEIIANKEGELAQKIGLAAINSLTDYLKVGYALQKVDQVGIPDFSAGAMENFGHVSFREKSLFFNEISGTAATKQANILTITHELVHQWFGNLVTLKSWDYIWLNEAFANYIEYIIASNFSETKDWNLMNQMVVNEIHLRAFETDGLESSTPLNNKILDENLIFSSFNDIPYSKGAAVLRMWNLQVGDTKFQKVLQEYLKTYCEKAVEPADLGKILKDKAEINENNFKTWTDEAGYPVVEVKKANETYTLSQRRFFWQNKTSQTSWVVPITYSADNFPNFSNTTPMYWLEGKEITFKHKCKWIIVNNQQAGYYRVNYDQENWVALAKALSESEYSKIPEVSRAQIINDVFSLARSVQKNYVSYSTALDLAKYLKTEQEFVPWKTALNAFEFLRNKINKEDMKKFKDYVLPLVTPHYKALNSTKLSHIEKLKNVEISRFVCSLDYETCVKESKDIFNKSSYGSYPDTQEIILCTVVRNDKNAWEKVSQKYKEAKDSALKIMYISALGCSGNETQIKPFLEGTVTGNSILRKQDLTYALSSVYNGNLNNVETAFKFIETNYEKIAEMYGGINPLGRAVVGIARKLKSSDQLERLKKLAEKINSNPKLSAAKNSVSDALNIAGNNAEWVKSKLGAVRKYINSGSFLSYSITLLSLSLLTVFQF